MNTTQIAIAHDAEKIQAWGKRLPTLGLTEAITNIDYFINNLKTHAPNKKEFLDVIELIRPFIHQLNPLLKNQHKENDARDYIKLLKREINAYEYLLETPAELTPTDLTTTIHRSLVNKIQDQVTHYRFYFLIPERKWLRIHRLFYIAMKNKIAQAETKDEVYFAGQKLNILNLYCYLLLLSCARLNHFESSDIVSISNLLKEWCTLVKISKTPIPDTKNQLMVDIATGSAPHFTKIFSPVEVAIPCYLQIDDLMQALVNLMIDETKREEEYISSHVINENSPDADIARKREPKHWPNQLDVRKIEYLIATWNGYLYDESSSDKAETPVELCIGFEDIHFYLSGGKLLHDFLGDKSELSVMYDEEEDKHLIEQDRRSDLWTTFFSSKPEDIDFKKTPAEYNFQHHFKCTNLQQHNDTHPRWFATMTEVTPRSCSIIWEAEREPLLALGQLVALHNGPNAHWQLGEIDLKSKLDDGRIKTGVRIMSTQAIPVGIDLPLDSNENYCEAILTPPEDALNTSTSIISPRHDYKNGDYVSVAQKNIEEKIQITKLININDYYERCECAFLVKKRVSGSYRDGLT